MLLKLIFKEAMHRKLNFVLSLLAVTCAVAFFVAFFTANQASKRETIRLTRDMGFNLRIIPKETDMNEFWTQGYSGFFMPVEYIDVFWDFKNFSFAHLTATLHKKINWQGKEVILTGIAPEIEPSGKTKTSMIFTVDPGTVYVGYELAECFKIHRNDTIRIKGEPFIVVKTLSETGSNDDIRIYGLLSEFQELLGLQGKINEIMALNCLCVSPDEEDPLVIIREQLQQVLPAGKVIMNTTIATARERQRHMLEKYFSRITVLLIVVIAIWIASLTMINVKDRQQETGILRAIGHSTLNVAGLFIGRALFIGIVSAILGYLAGTFLALEYGPDIFKITSGTIKAIPALFLYALVAAPVFSVLSAVLPVMFAVLQNPAYTVRKN